MVQERELPIKAKFEQLKALQESEGPWPLDEIRRRGKEL